MLITFVQARGVQCRRVHVLGAYQLVLPLREPDSKSSRAPARTLDDGIKQVYGERTSANGVDELIVLVGTADLGS
jgi:hypothetical protein